MAKSRRPDNEMTRKLLPLIDLARRPSRPLTPHQLAELRGIFCAFFRRSASGCDATASDFFQDLLLNVLKYGTRYDPARERFPGAWVWSIARNLVAKHLQRQGRTSRGYESDELAIQLAACDARGPAELAETHELQVFLSRRSQFNANERALLERRLDEADIEDIAHTEGLQHDGVRTRINRGRHSLRERLREAGFRPD